MKNQYVLIIRENISYLLFWFIVLIYYFSNIPSNLSYRTLLDQENFYNYYR